MSICRVADYLMGAIADLGVKEVFFLPGGGAMHLNDGLACEKRLVPVPCHHEQACGIAAESNGRTNAAGFGVALVTTGPGATNVLTPVAGAWIESLPMLVISGQVKRVDALNGRPLRQGGVQEVDVVSMVRPVTKYAKTLLDPSQVKQCFEEAIWHMRNGRPGPVWLDVPLDVQAAPIDPKMLVGFVPPAVFSERQDLAPTIDRLNELLAHAQRPLLLVGHGVRIAGAAENFRKLVEQLGIPCAFTWNAADLLHWDHPLYVGRPGVVAARAPNFAVQNCDCLISIGCRLDNVVTAYNPQGFAREAKKVVVDVDANELARHEMNIDLPVCADAQSFIDAWLKSRRWRDGWDEWRARCADWKHRYPPQEGRALGDDGVITHYPFIDLLSEAVPEDRLIVTGSSGLAVEVFYTVFRNKPGQRFFLTSGLGSMGYGLPAAIGACLGAGRRLTVGVESDGSLMLNLQELATLKAMNLPIVLIIMNNGGYASIRNTQRNYFSGRYLGTGPEAGLFIPDLVAVSGAMGLPAMRIENASALVAGLQHALNQPGPFVCEVCLGPNETLSPKVAAIPQPDGSIVSMPLEDMSPLLTLEQLQAEMQAELLRISIDARDTSGHD
jgi:acetolactate synthase-1/2/3 large subunit